MDDLNQVASEVRVCQKCPLAATRIKAVPGEGPANAEVMLIGEGPGFNEDKQGRPFVGASGNFLNELLAAAGYKREEVFITNVVKCRPPGNRDPQPNEIEACSEYLERQMLLINPKIIVTLGRFSMSKFFPGAKISAIHGQAKLMNGRAVVPMFHPAAALHQPALRQSIEDDFRKLKQIIAEVNQSAASTLASKAVSQGPASKKAPSQDDSADNGADNGGESQLSLF